MDFETWLEDLRKEYPADLVEATKHGAIVTDDQGEVIEEFDYDPDPDYEARIRY